MDKWKGVAQKLLDLLFPPRCAGCKHSGQLICAACLKTMQPLTAPICRSCGSPLSPHGRCLQCQYRQPAISGLRIVNSYQGPLLSSIHDFKYAGNKRVAAPLGKLLAQAYRAYGMQADLIIPVPLHTERERERGF